MPSYQSNRDELRQRVIKMRRNGYTWGDISVALKINSPATARRMYKEANLDPHVDLSGRPTRTFEEGEWCKDTCIASEPSASCHCRCGRANHAGGPARALEILSLQGVEQDRIDAKVARIARLQQSGHSE